MFIFPISYKPTFLNMNIHLENLTVNDCVTQNAVNQEVCTLLFGENMDWALLSNVSIYK